MTFDPLANGWRTLQGEFPVKDTVKMDLPASRR
jgi:hypothetical protein